VGEIPRRPKSRAPQLITPGAREVKRRQDSSSLGAPRVYGFLCEAPMSDEKEFCST
jgi:hypothetical protein